jgi:pyruvate dehydrogenase E1 component alpha subunit
MREAHSLLLDLYRIMLRVRTVDETIAEHYSRQKMRCPVHLSIGQEAICTAAAATLEPHDSFFGTHRSHGPYLASGGDVYTMLAEMHGKADGCCAGRGGSMHLLNIAGGFWGSIPIVGSTIPIATGAALAFKMRKERRVGMVLLGEASTEEGVFHESIQYAVLKQLPVVYVCENNRFSVNTPIEERRPPQFSILNLAKVHGLHTYGAFGNDVLAVHKGCREAVERARNGGGPSFLEFDTYRWKEHCGPNDDHHLPCRSPEDFSRWKKLCPLLLAEQTLLEFGILGEEQIHSMKEQEKQFVEEAMRKAQEAPFPAEEEADYYVYAPGMSYA